MMHRHTWTTALALSLGLVVMFPSNEAEACGGFFCSQNQPVNQAAERIIFSHNGDGTVTAVVQIQYEGPSERFAWVLPVPGVPTIGVSSDTVFTRIQTATNPTYNLTTTVEGTCRLDGNSAAESFSNGFSQPTANDSGGQGGGVNVLASGSVGPFDYVVIMVEPDREDLAEVAVSWLEDNNYDVTSVGPDLIRPYLEDGMNLVAFRLSKGNSAGDIRPVVLTYDSEAPMIPIKLTAVAAEANMGVLVWVLSDQRAVPINYRSLEVNEALINWFNASQNYNDVINVAADEAGGQGFVTEYAGDSANLADVVRLPQDDQCIPEISAEATDSQLGDAIAEVIFACPDATGLGMALAEAMPEGDMQDATGFVVCAQRWGLETINGATLGCTDFQQGESFMFDATGIDTARLTTAARENILDPLDEAQALFQARGYTTRLYTTMSAAEMTLDPVFRFNPDLATVDNIHNATRIIECNSSVYQWEAPWRVELPSGDVIRGSDTNWPIEPGTMPANRQILQDSTSGSAEVITDNSTTIAQALEESNSRFPGQSSDDEGCACSTTHTNPAFPPLALLVVGLLALVRRRH